MSFFRPLSLARLRALLSSRSGNFSITTALMVPMLFGAAGMAVDYTHATAEATRLQLAVDAAALAIAQGSESMTDAQALELAKTMLVSNHSAVDAAFTVIRNGTDATVRGTSSVDTTLSRIFGLKKLTIVREAAATVVEYKYEIAMALDTTGSMEGGKLSALKEAATSLVTDLDAKITRPDNLKFALVPFSFFVNVGAGQGPLMSNGLVTRQPADWLDYNGVSPIAQRDFGTGISRFPFFHHLGHEWAGCVESRGTLNGRDLATTDDAPSQSTPATLFVPAFSNDEPNSSYYMNNYVGDTPATINQSTADERRKRYGANYATAPTTLAGWAASEKTWAAVTQDNSGSTFYSNYHYAKGPNFMCVTRPILPLTTDYAAVKTAINELFAAGSTNIAEGAAWGWRVLSHGAPFTEGRASSEEGVHKVLILLTDGTNSFGHTYSTLGSAYSSYGYLADGRLGTTSTDPNVTTAKMNDKTLATCDNAKKDGIEIYTILLEESNTTTSSLLEKCTSDPAHFIAVPDRSGLDKAFAAIKSGITGTRLKG